MAREPRAYPNLRSKRARYPRFRSRRRFRRSATVTTTGLSYGDGWIGLARCDESLGIAWSRRRRGHLRKRSTRTIRDNQTVVIEDLAVRDMVRNHSLARTIHDRDVNAAINILAAGLAVPVSGDDVGPARARRGRAVIDEGANPGP